MLLAPSCMAFAPSNNALSQYLSAVTSRSTYLLEGHQAGLLPEATSLLANASRRASLRELASQLSSDDSLQRAEALHTIASSPELSGTISARLSSDDQANLLIHAARLKGLAGGGRWSGFKLVFLGDIHDNWGPVRRIVKQECRSGNEVVLGVGDLETYKSINTKVPFLFSHGNHENLEEMAWIRKTGETPLGTPHPLMAGDFALIRGGLVLGAFSGIYDKETYERGAKAVFPFFSQDDVAKTLNIPLPVDLLLAHEAPAGVGLLREGRDLGSTVLADLLERLQPSVAFFGHHHRENFDGWLGKTRVIGLDYPKLSYVTATVDESSGELVFERHRAKAVEKAGSKVYQYDWEIDEGSGASARLFSLGMPNIMERENDIAGFIDRQYRQSLSVRLTPTLLPRMGNDQDTPRTKELLAQGLVNGLFNTILPYFARYYASAKASLSEKEKGLLLESCIREMLAEQVRIPYAHDDLRLAFRELASLAKPAV